MQLKVVTTLKNGALQRHYVNLGSAFKHTTPNKDGDFGDQWASYDDTSRGDLPAVPDETVAIIYMMEQGAIFIHKCQEAYILNTDGSTQSVVHRPAKKKLWRLDKNIGLWSEVTDVGELVNFMGLRNRGNSFYEYAEFPEGVNPNDK
jgi:hypothetical protein